MPFDKPNPANNEVAIVARGARVRANFDLSFSRIGLIVLLKKLPNLKNYLRI